MVPFTLNVSIKMSNFWTRVSRI